MAAHTTQQTHTHSQFTMWTKIKWWMIWNPADCCLFGSHSMCYTHSSIHCIDVKYAIFYCDMHSFGPLLLANSLASFVVNLTRFIVQSLAHYPYCEQVNDCNRLPFTSWWIGKSDINRRHRLGNHFCVVIQFEFYFGIGRVDINLRWAFFLKEAVIFGRNDVNTYMKNVDLNESENGTEKKHECLELIELFGYDGIRFIYFFVLLLRC